MLRRAASASVRTGSVAALSAATALAAVSLLANVCCVNTTVAAPMVRSQPSLMRSRLDGRNPSVLFPYRDTPQPRVCSPYASLRDQHEPAEKEEVVTVSRRMGFGGGRRSLLRSIGTLPLSLYSISSASFANAAPPPEALSNAASKIPGYGMPDLYFPEYFEGTWDCISELVDIRMPQGEALVPNVEAINSMQKYLGRPEMLLRYNQTYFKFRNHIIAERGENTQNVRQAAQFNPESNIWYRAQRSEISEVTWDPANPNALNYVMDPGQKYEVLVTKRGFEQPNDNIFITSEVVRQTQTDLSQLNPPVVKQVQDQVKYRHIPATEDEPQTIQAILISSVFLTPEGRLEDYMKAGGKPITVYRSRVIMKKLP